SVISKEDIRSTSDKNLFGKRERQLVSHHNESADRRKTGMTDIYIELGGKKAIAWSLEWPGWCRIRTSEAAAVQALIETEVRYRLIAQRAGLKFAPGDLMVVERLPGDANTAWGVPSVLAPAETRPIDVVTTQRGTPAGGMGYARRGRHGFVGGTAQRSAWWRSRPRRHMAPRHRSRASICAQDRGATPTLRDERQKRPQSHAGRDHCCALEALQRLAAGCR